MFCCLVNNTVPVRDVLSRVIAMQVNGLSEVKTKQFFTV